MESIKQNIEAETLKMVTALDWHSIIIDMEVELRGRAPKNYFVDSSVAVCICKMDGVLTDHDLDLSKEYRELFYRLYELSDTKWGSCRIIIFRGQIPDWHFTLPPSKRLDRLSDNEVDELIEKLLVSVKP